MASRWINLALLLCALAISPLHAGNPPGTLEELEATTPGIITSLLDKIDLSTPDLAPTRDLLQKGHPVKAGYALLDYYKHSAKKYPWLNSAHFVGRPDLQIPLAQAAIANTFTLQGITAPQKKQPPNKINWNDLGPKHDQEWSWMLNRHLWFLDYIGAWANTGNNQYPAAFNTQITDWLQANPTPPFWMPANSSSWRPLEVGRRLYESWPPSFYAFQQSPEFTPATRILMLASIHTQAEYCLKNLSSQGNHLNTELIGLAAAATYWPEFKHSKKWLDASATYMRHELARRIYPDGAQMELSNHYQIVVATHCQTLANLLHIAHHPDAPTFDKYSEKLWAYIRLVTKPNREGPLNNDCELETNFNQIMAVLSRSLLVNPHNKSGIASLPLQFDNLPSTYFPWAGHAIMRSTEPSRPDWLFFDVGPLGTAHQHYDTLNIALQTAGRDILVDAGRYTYKAGKWRRYFTGQSAHNIVLLDGGGENLEPRQTRKPINAHWNSTPQYDFASGITHIRLPSWLGNDIATHRRSLLYVKNKYYLILDEVLPSSASQIEVPWHFHPDCTTLIQQNGAAETIDKNKGNLRILPIPLGENIHWTATLANGQIKPEIQGWYSANYNIRLPAPVVTYRLKKPIPTANKTLRFAWLLIPGKDTPPTYKTSSIRSPKGDINITVETENGKKDTITVTPSDTLALPPGVTLTLPGATPLTIH